MAISAPAQVLGVHDVPAVLHRSAARTVIRWLVPLQAVMVALGALETATSGDVLPLQLAAVAVLVSTLPGTLIATDAVARYRLDGTLRRMQRELHVMEQDPAV